jgi:hypothetical protein
MLAADAYGVMPPIAKLTPRGRCISYCPAMPQVAGTGARTRSICWLLLNTRKYETPVHSLLIG